MALNPHRMNAPAKEKRYWLVKSEGGCYSIDDLKRDKKAAWTGIRNYQARNYMRDMGIGDEVFFYHSGAEPLGIYGIARVVSALHPDATAQDKKDEHYDPKATTENPIWMCVDMEFVRKFDMPLSLDEMKKNKHLSSMIILKRGNRLSVTPVAHEEYDEIIKNKI